MDTYRYLDAINSPDDLKKLNTAEVKVLASEIRDFLVEAVTKNGGHLASNLGVVELTLAMHRVFHSPEDHFIFDVGHQSYVHKILTGRRDALMDSLRQNGGLSGFTRRSESPHDPFGAGHASTSLSAAIGMAEAEQRKGSGAYTVCVIGDGAFTGGMIHEALNNVRSDLRLIIILNENEMSISRNTGSFAQLLLKIRLSAGYHDIKNNTRTFLQKLPLIGDPLFRGVRAVKKSLKNFLYSSNYFEDIGLYYLGPADGNDFETVETLLKIAKETPQSVVLHLKTQKGKGWEPSEQFPDEFHAVPKMKYYHAAAPHEDNKTCFSDQFGAALLSLMRERDDLQAITAAMTAGTGLRELQKELPERVTDVGIAEAHALTYAAGLAAGGIHPVAAIYSSFLQRSYDSLIHDIALQHLPLTLCVDRAGYNEGDGMTHHGIFDVAMLSELPEAEIYAPLSYASLARYLRDAVASPTFTAIRYPKGAENPALNARFSPYPEDSTVLTDFPADDLPAVLIVTYGLIAAQAVKAEETLSAEGIRAGIVVLEKLTPYPDRAGHLLRFVSDETRALIFLEEGIYRGGAGMLLSDLLKEPLAAHGIPCRVLAIEDPFLPSEVGKSMAETAGIDCTAVVSCVHRIWK